MHRKSAKFGQKPGIKPLYCDRELKVGRTCRELAPALKHKLDVRRKKAIEELDRDKRRIHKRHGQTRGFGEKTVQQKSELGKILWLDRVLMREIST